jgi:hypothetical protein
MIKRVFKINKMSDGLSERLLKMAIGGKHLNDDSKHSEKVLNSAIDDIILPYARDHFVGYSITQIKSISLFECQEFFYKYGGPEPNPENSNVSMRPDGGIMIATKDGINTPFLIIEDKVQGTNDTRILNKQERQSTGNAIERAGKNIRCAEMLFSGLDIFPYILFASGCDLHHTETISKRIEQMNYGVKTHYIPITPDLPEKIDTFDIDIKKRFGGRCVFSAFVKAHKYDEMPHGSSAWSKQEIARICCKVIDQITL